MKKTVILLLLGTLHLTAQNKPEFRINLHANYVFDDRFDSRHSYTSYYHGYVRGGDQWGLDLEFMPHRRQGIELTYSRQETKAPTTYYDDRLLINPLREQTFDVAFNYLMLGTTHYLKISDLLEPYLGAQMGMAIVGISNPLNGHSRNFTKLAWGLKGGTNIWLSKELAVKVQAAFNSVVQGAGGSLYFSGEGTSAGLSLYSTVFQFSLGTGLVLKIGELEHQGQPEPY